MSLICHDIIAQLRFECLKSAICANVPRMMSCEHVVCTNCLLAAIEGHKDITCYVCGILIPPSTHIEAYPKDMKIIRSLKERKRSDDIGAKILNLSDAILSDKDPSKNIMQTQPKEMLQIPHKICEAHKKELDLICLTDRQRLCAHCAIFGSHRDHKFKTLIECQKQFEDRDTEFANYEAKKEQLDSKFSSPELKESIRNQISQQKDQLVASIRTKYATLYENIRLAQKSTYEEVIKKFRAVFERINTLLKEQSEVNKAYNEWRDKCKVLFQKVDRISTIEEKVMHYFGGDMDICRDGKVHVQRVQKKIDASIQTMEHLIKRIKIVEKPGIAEDVFNYLSIYVQEFDECIMSYESDDDDHRKPTKVEFGNGNIELNTFLNSSRTGRKSQTEDSRMRNSRKSMDMDPLELVKLQTQKKEMIEKVVQEYCERDNLDTLDLSNYQITDTQVYDILNYLKPIKKIKALKLIKNKLTNQGVSRVLDFMPYTTNLNLSFNSLNEDILIFLHNNREKMPNLRIVNLSNNKINERKAKAYTEQLKKIGIIVML